MSRAADPAPEDDDEWTTIREFTEGETGYTQPKYEAKAVPGGDQGYADEELVLVKVTSSINGHERLHRFPRSVFEAVVDEL